MENHVVSKELSKRLYDLGVRVESKFYWIVGRKLKTVNLEYIQDEHFATYSDEHYLFYPALLSSEIGELLMDIEIQKKKGVLSRKIKWYIKHIESGYVESHQNEAEARGLLLEYLLENKLIEL